MSSAAQLRAAGDTNYPADSRTLAHAYDIAQEAQHQGHTAPPTCHPCSMVGFHPEDPAITEKACPRCGCTFDTELHVTTQGRQCAYFRTERLAHLRSTRPVQDIPPADRTPLPRPEPRRKEATVSFRVDGHCPGCGLAFDVKIIPIHVKDGAAMTMDDAIKLGIVKDWPASRPRRPAERAEPLPTEEAVPLPPPQEPPDRNPAAAADEDHQARTQDAKRARAAAGKVCPQHMKAKPSKFGALFCPTPDQSSSTGWCQWSSRPTKEEAA